MLMIIMMMEATLILCTFYLHAALRIFTGTRGQMCGLPLCKVIHCILPGSRESNVCCTSGLWVKWTLKVAIYCNIMEDACAELWPAPATLLFRHGNISKNTIMSGPYWGA